MKRLLPLLLALLTVSSSQAHDFEAGGFFYNINQSPANTVSVTHKGDYPQNNPYTGEISIPERVIHNGRTYTVTAIGKNAFFRCGVTSVTIPNTVTSIAEKAFKECRRMTSVTIPNSVTSIGHSAFMWCTGLTSVTIPGSVASIYEQAFLGCSELTSVTIPASVTYIGSWAFDIEGLKEVNYNAENCTSCGSYWASAFPSQLSTLNIGENVRTIPANAFNGCGGLTSVDIPGSVTSIGERAFIGCSGLMSVAIPESVTSISDETFSGCGSLVSVSIPGSVTYIGEEAFYGCGALASVAIPGSVTSIGEKAFSGCGALTSVTIPVSVTSVGEQAFNGCEGLIKSAFPNTLVNPFDTGVSIGYNPDGAILEDGFIYGPGKNVIYFAPLSYEGELVIPGTVTTIAESAFCNCDGLMSARIPGSVTSIGRFAFSDCSSLGYIDIKINGAIGDHAFQNCSSAVSVEVGPGVTDIGTYAFAGCSSAATVVIAPTVNSIGDYAFQGCESLADVTFEESAVDCADSGLLTLGSNGSEPLFADCPLDEVFIGRGLSFEASVSKGYSPFYGNASLRSVEFSDAETMIYFKEFDGCVNLQNVRIGNGVKTLATYSFASCVALTECELGDAVEELGPSAFYGCTAMISMTSHNMVPPACGDGALYDINKELCTLYVPETAIEAYKAARQWKDFYKIEAGVEDILVSEGETDVTVTARYDLMGNKVGDYYRGPVIEVMGDGSVAKRILR